jgi:hypothetical protein
VYIVSGGLILKKCPGCQNNTIPVFLFEWAWKCDLCKIKYCNSCHKKFIRIAINNRPEIKYSPQECIIHNKPKDINICSSCADKLNEQNKQYQDLYNNHKNVETFPETYKGKIPFVEGSQKAIISSNWFKEKEDTLIMLQISALKTECNIVFNIKYENKSHHEGNYYYKVWKATGIPAKRK